MALPILHPFASLDYPDTDGLPMAESDFQLTPLLYAVAALRTYFAARADVYVAGNLFIYYEEGNRQAVVAPDVFVVIGAAKHARSSYLLWREPKGPDFVLEITSDSTRNKDRDEKPKTYALLGVQEYFQYDPTKDYLEPPLQGFRLVHGLYQSLPVITEPPGRLVVHSDGLGLDLCLADEGFRFYDPVTGQKLLTFEESEQARLAAEQAQREIAQRARHEAALRQAAEARIAELEARLQALQASGSAEPPADVQS